MPDITDDLAELRKWIDQATSGPWELVTDGSGQYEAYVYATTARYAAGMGAGSPVKVAWCPTNFGDQIEPQHKRDARYIAACSPDRIRRVVDECERLRADAARLEWMQTALLRRASIRLDDMTFREVNAWEISADGADLRAAIDAARTAMQEQPR